LKSRLLGALIAACVLLPAGNALADTVYPTDVAAGDPWTSFTRDAGTFSFAPGPAGSLGVGSLRLDTSNGPTAGNDKVAVFTKQYVGQKIADIDAIGYSSYRFPSTASPLQTAALNIVVDPDGDTGSAPLGVLIYEPEYSHHAGVQDDTWQTWDAYDGGNAQWWGANIASPGGFTADWSDWVAAYPNATIAADAKNSFGFNEGGGNPDLHTAVDGLTIGFGGAPTVFDFEPLVGPPTSKDQCKNGGYTQFNNPSFKNQGDCVSYVASKK
jgi:hypothetical protein